MKNFGISFLLILCFAVSGLANAAQPGIRSAGGSAGFTLLFPEDSAAFKKVQMRREMVNIQLYKGFAVVKGTYWMYNHSTSAVNMKMGYPINALYASGYNESNIAEIIFDKLFELSVRVDSVDVDYEKIDFELDDPDLTYLAYGEKPSWYIWTTTFPPAMETVIEVFFIVNTNDATVSKGYNKRSFNGFIYVLESGASWKPPIEEGSVRVALKEGLRFRDIHGVAPGKKYLVNEKEGLMVYQFENLIPDKQDNLVITYSQRLEDFNFEEILQKSDQYFNRIEAFSKTTIQSDSLSVMEFNSPFEIGSEDAVGLIGFVLLNSGWILGGIGLLFVVLFFLRRKR